MREGVREGVKMRTCEDEKMRYRPPLLEEPCAQTLSGTKTPHKVVGKKHDKQSRAIGRYLPIFRGWVPICHTLYRKRPASFLLQCPTAAPSPLALYQQPWLRFLRVRLRRLKATQLGAILPHEWFAQQIVLQSWQC